MPLIARCTSPPRGRESRVKRNTARTKMAFCFVQNVIQPCLAGRPLIRPRNQQASRPCSISPVDRGAGRPAEEAPARPVLRAVWERWKRRSVCWLLDARHRSKLGHAHCRTAMRRPGYLQLPNMTSTHRVTSGKTRGCHAVEARSH